MKYILSTVFALALLLPAFVADAAAIGVIEKSSQVDFTFKTKDIVRSAATGDVRFSFEVMDIKNPQKIAYWKVRSYCDKGMTVGVTASSTNDCGKAVRMDTLPNNSFSALFDNATSDTKKFSFKLKAYDSKGNWLNTERQAFTWK